MKLLRRQPLACADLQVPKGLDMGARATDPQLGLSIRLLRAFDIMHDRWVCRLDILYGVLCQRRQLACRVAS